MDVNKKKSLTAAEMQQGFNKVRCGACCRSRCSAELRQVGVSLSLQQLNVLCSGPFGRNNEFAYAELKSNVAASLATTVTNVQAAMTVVLRVIKNRDMSTHTLFNMMDSSKKVLLCAASVVSSLMAFYLRDASTAASLLLASSDSTSSCQRTKKRSCGSLSMQTATEIFPTRSLK